MESLVNTKANTNKHKHFLRIKTTEVVLLHWNMVNSNYQQTLNIFFIS